MASGVIPSECPCLERTSSFYDTTLSLIGLGSCDHSCPSQYRIDPSGLGQQLCFCVVYGYPFLYRGSDFLDGCGGVFIVLEVVFHWRAWHDCVHTE